MLSESERNILLRVARASIEAAVHHVPPETDEEFPPPLNRCAGAFVTLRIANELRGCIGFIEAVKPLVETVREAAARAALEDYRFAPLTAEELAGLDVEISVLSPMERIDHIEAIEVGKHGLLVARGNFRGLLLPQVPVEQGWDREMFLNHATRKAGLPPHYWQLPGTELYAFTAEVFGEHSTALSHS